MYPLLYRYIVSILVIVPEYAQHQAPIEIFFPFDMSCRFAGYNNVMTRRMVMMMDDDDGDDDHNEFYNVVAVVDMIIVFTPLILKPQCCDRTTH